MHIIRDYSYISNTDRLLEQAGYGTETVYSIHFDRRYSEEQKSANARLSHSMTTEEWENHCDRVGESFHARMMEILEAFVSRYDIHQVSDETNTMAHYKSDWDLFFWSNRGWNGKEYMSCFSLTFNKNRTAKQNMELLEKIVPIVEAMEYETIACRIQYDIVFDENKLAKDAKAVCEKLAGKPIQYCGMTGKIKAVEKRDDIVEYGFFRTRARSRYYPISNKELLADWYCKDFFEKNHGNTKRVSR